MWVATHSPPNSQFLARAILYGNQQWIRSVVAVTTRYVTQRQQIRRLNSLNSALLVPLFQFQNPLMAPYGRTVQYRHIPRYVEVGIPHYRPITVETPVERPVPVPVDLEIEEEILQPQWSPQ